MNDVPVDTIGYRICETTKTLYFDFLCDVGSSSPPSTVRVSLFKGGKISITNQGGNRLLSILWESVLSCSRSGVGFSLGCESHLSVRSRVCRGYTEWSEGTGVKKVSVSVRLTRYLTLVTQ